MRSFKDSDGRQWFIKLNLEVIEKVEAATGIALDDIATSNPRSPVELQSGSKLVGVLWTIVEDDAHKRNVSRSQFAQSMDGDCTAAAREALTEEQIFFSPPAWRESLAEVNRIGKEVVKAQLAMAIKEAEGQLSEASAESSPESSESTQDSGPSES